MSKEKTHGGARKGAGRPAKPLDARKSNNVGKVPVWLSPHAILQLIELQSKRGWGGDQLVETLISEAHEVEFKRKNVMEIKAGLRCRVNGRPGTITEVTDGTWVDVVFDDGPQDQATVVEINDPALEIED